MELNIEEFSAKNSRPSSNGNGWAKSNGHGRWQTGEETRGGHHTQLGRGGHCEALVGGDLLTGGCRHLDADLLWNLAARCLVHLKADLLVLTVTHPVCQRGAFTGRRNIETDILFHRCFAFSLEDGEALLGGHLLAVVHSLGLAHLVGHDLGHADALLRRFAAALRWQSLAARLR